MKKIGLKTFLCFMLCLAMTVSLFGCGGGGNTGSDVADGDMEYGDPALCTLCPDKNRCCFCYQYGDCVCEERDAAQQNGDDAASGTESGSGNRRPSGTTTGGSTGTTGGSTGGNGGSGGSTAAAKPGSYDPKQLEGKTLIILRSWGPYKSGVNTAHDNWIKGVANFEKTYKCDVVEKAWKAELATDIQAGVKPEGHVYQIQGDHVASSVRAGYIAPWDDAMKETGIDMTSDVYFRRSVQLNNYNGKQYAIGVEEGKMMSQICYNMALVKEASPNKTIEQMMDDGTWTWDAMEDIATKVKAKHPEKAGIQCSGLFPIYGMVASNGGQLVSIAKDGTVGSNLNDKRVMEALDRLHKWIFEGNKIGRVNQSGEGWDTGIKMIIKGDLAFSFQEDACYSHLKSGMSADGYGIAYLPKGPSADQYYTAIESSWPIVMPRNVPENKGKDPTPADLLFMIDKLYGLGNRSKDDQFKDLYVRQFGKTSDYQRVYNMHRTIKAAPIIEIELVQGGSWSEFCTNLEQKGMTAAELVQRHQSAFDAEMKDTWKGVKFTGVLD